MYCRFYKFLIAFIFVICIPFFTTGQHTWSLQDCVEHALKNNINIKQSKNNLQQSKITLIQKKMQLVPSLNGSVSNNFNYGRSVDPFAYVFTNSEIQSINYSLSSNVTLFNGFQLMNELKKSQLDYMSGKYDLEKISNDVSLNVTSAYLQVLFAKDQVSAAQNRFDQSAKEQIRSKALKDAGSLTEGNFLDTDAQLANDELALINAENQYIIAKLTLAQLLELDETDSVNIDAPQTEVPDLSVLMQSPQQIYQLAQNTLPELKGAAYKLMSARKDLSIARGSRSPRLSAFGSLSSGYSSQTIRPVGDRQFLGYLPNGSITSAGDTVLAPISFVNSEKASFDFQKTQNYNKAFGFSLSIPLFNGWSVGGNISRAKLNLQNAEYTSDISHQQVYKSIQQAHADAKGAQKKYAAARKSLDALRSSFSYTEKKYNAGLISSLDFLTIKNNLTKAESDFIQAKYDYIFRVKVLDFYAGKPLAL